MTPSQTAKALGCKSLTQVSELTGASLQTLSNWHKSKPELFAVVCIGASEYINHYTTTHNQKPHHNGAFNDGELRE